MIPKCIYIITMTRCGLMLHVCLLHPILSGFSDKDVTAHTTSASTELVLLLMVAAQIRVEFRHLEVEDT